ncbi:MAG: alpha/beta hydrolase [Hyphomonas sp.]
MKHDLIARAARALLCLPLAACATAPLAEAGPAAAGEPEVRRNVVYGTGLVDASTVPRERDLLLDAYLPAVPGAEAAPAIIMVFGGAYHRGTKEAVSFVEDGAQDSSMADYCAMFARNGIACFAIEYRLTPEDPAFPAEFETALTVPKALLEDPGATARIEHVRRLMGLAPLDEVSREQYWAASFAAVADTQTALSHIRQQVAVYGIDPDRIALGGFSAGAVTVLNLAYGAGADVSAVVSISGGIWGHDVTATAARGQPPLLLFAGQTDLPGMRWGSSELAKLFAARGIPVETAWVPGFGHFYPMGATSLGPDFTKESVEERILKFLNRHFQASTAP